MKATYASRFVGRSVEATDAARVEPNLLPGTIQVRLVAGTGIGGGTADLVRSARFRAEEAAERILAMRAEGSSMRDCAEATGTTVRAIQHVLDAAPGGDPGRKYAPRPKAAPLDAELARLARKFGGSLAVAEAAARLAKRTLAPPPDGELGLD